MYAVYEWAKPASGNTKNKSNPVKTVRPPKRSVRIPIGTREMVLHAAKETANASVASPRLM